MLIYICMLVFIVAVCIIYKQTYKQLLLADHSVAIDSKKRWSTFGVFVCVWGALNIVSALRYDVGTDFMNYKTFISREVWPNWEIGFKILIKLVHIVTTNYQFFIVVVGLVFVTLFCKCYWDYSRFDPLSVFLFIAMGIYFQSFCLLRQCLAIAIIFFSYRYLKERNIVALLLCIGVAATFHVSVLIVAPALILSTIRFTTKQYLMFSLVGFGVAFIIQMAAIKFIDYRYNGFFNEEVDKILPIYSILLSIVLFILALVYKKNLLEKNLNNHILINISFYFMIYVAAFCYVPVMSRCFQYFIPFFTLLIPQLVSSEQRSNTRNFYLVVIVLFYFVFMVFFAAYSSAGVTPYQTIFTALGAGV